MSTINKLILLTIFTLAFNSCTRKESAEKFEPLKRSQFSYHGSVQRNLGLEFVLNGNTERTITAIVTLPQYLNFKNQKLRYRWQLDQDIEVTSGERTGEISVITDDKKVEIKLRVNKFSVDTKKFIRFEASSEVNKNRFFIDGIVSSQSESSFENFVQGLENYKKREHLND